MLTQARLKEVLHYSPETGLMTWKSGANRKCSNQPAGTPRSDGYLSIGLDYRRYLAHRLAWLFVYGEMPDKGLYLDHIDGNKANNKISNLRLATHSQNQMNSKPRSVSGTKNVVWSESNKKWTVRFKANGKTLYYGIYKNLEDAKRVADSKRLELHGEFAYSRC